MLTNPFTDTPAKIAVASDRRIFFLESWLGAFLGGQTSDSARLTVRRYLDEDPGLPLDVRRKVLQYGDELERTVRIRAREQPASN